MTISDSPVRSLAVIGAGTMGHGIAQTAVMAGIETALVDVDQRAIDTGVAAIETSLARMVNRNRIQETDKTAALGRLRAVTAMAAIADVDAVIEAVPERLELKKAIFSQLDSVCTRAIFLGSNTSSLSLQEIASATTRPERVLGLHYFNPPQMLTLVEIVLPLTVAPEVVAAAEAFCRVCDRVIIHAKDTPGFVVNRLLVPFVLDAIRLMESGTATPEDIDEACRLGLGHTMGPLTTSDLIGLDVLLDVADSMWEETGDARVAAPALLRRLVSGGRVGRKSGHGIYEYGT